VKDSKESQKTINTLKGVRALIQYGLVTADEIRRVIESEERAIAVSTVYECLKSDISNRPETDIHSKQDHPQLHSRRIFAN